MPRYGNKKAKKAPKRNRRAGRKFHKKRTNGMTTVKVRGGAIIPDRTFVKLKYTEPVYDTMAAASSSFGYLSWRFNGLYDPSPGVSNPYPVGFPQYAALYDRYKVLGSKITVEFSNMEDFPVMIVVWPSATIPAGVNAAYLQAIISNTYSQHRLLSAKGGMDRSRISMYLSSKKLVGDRQTITDSTYSSVVTTNPTRLLYWNVGCYPVNILDVFTSSNVPFELRITYYSQFYDRKEFAAQLTAGDIDDDGNPVSNP